MQALALRATTRRSDDFAKGGTVSATHAGRAGTRKRGGTEDGVTQGNFCRWEMAC